ncbi:MAG: type II toxin-antitoxin system RelE/ParE family toxin [Defluviitaleaceae bacterium]|nr:type II toxin-antitoxin system RelE/ParE family toxin [Defluviitaleaceae bacterium]
MTREFIRTSYFNKRWDEMKLTDDDLRELENHIMQNPNIGNIIQGTGGAIKIRWALRGNNQGKSGGLRVIYVDLIIKAHIHLLLCYPKSEQEDLTHDQKKQLKQLISTLKGE